MKKNGINLELVKKENRSLILKCINANGPMSRKDIADLTHLTAASVTQITTKLINENILTELGSVSESTGLKGRKKVLLDIDHDKKIICAINIDTQKTTIAICNLNGELVTDSHNNPSIREYKTQRKLKPELFLHDICQETLGLFQGLSSACRKKLSCISVSVPGIIDKESGIAQKAYSLWDQPVPVKDILSDELLLNVPILVSNSVNAFATAEILFGAGKQYDSLLVIKWGPELESTIVVDSVVYEGRHGKTAELGHFIVEKDGPLCSCGRKGCLKSYVSSSYLADILKISDFRPEDFGSCYKKADISSQKRLDQIMDYFAESIVNACAIIVPDRIVLAGSLFKDRFIRDKLIDACKSYDPAYDNNRLIYSAIAGRESYIGPAAVYIASALFGRYTFDKK